MNYEKEYKKLKAGIKNAYLYAQTNSTKAVLEHILPELRKSEDERIRNEIIAFVEQAIHRGGGTPIPQEQEDSWIAWLEKQCPVNKIKPKFHKGEWVVWQDKCYKVNYNGCGYELIDQNGLHTSLEYGTIDENAHLWTISDAKDGDVLVNGSNIFIFHFINDTRLMGYCHVNTDDGRFYDDIGKNECFCLIDAVVNPATKEQRDTLMKAMNDAGWEFDFEKKELKKLSQQEVTKISDQDRVGCEANCTTTKGWSEEDENRAKDTIYFLDTAKKHYASTVELDACIDWLKSLKQRIGG